MIPEENKAEADCAQQARANHPGDPSQGVLRPKSHSGARIVALMDGGATITDCYRYDLWRRWGAQGADAMFVCLNPSTADDLDDDPTLRRCIGFARSWGFGGVRIGNLFAYRAQDPRQMLRAPDPVGPRNDEYLLAMAQSAAIVVAAWGNLCGHLGRGARVRQLLPRLHYLRLTQSGQPGHPLYLPATLMPQLWR